MLLTTSRRPTERMRTFCRDFANSIPDVMRVNRGKISLDGLAEKAIELDSDRVVVVDRWRGRPGKLSLFQISPTGLKPVPPLMLIEEIRLRREFKEGRRRARSSTITVKSEDSIELTRIAARLAKFFGLPILSLDEARKRYLASMLFSFTVSGYIQITFMLLSRLVEIGPRVTLSKVIWEVT